tara:strand:+ start:133 stop:525 length:393 start_codon:yes stop_codon:yes gene_type:complete
MAHLSFEYTANLEGKADLAKFCELMCKVMNDSNIFPQGGIRVRGTKVDVHSVGNGDPHFAFVDIKLRMGQGRNSQIREAVGNSIYAAAETWFREKLGPSPFALSLEVFEIKKRFSIKSYNNLHEYVITNT